MMTNRENAMAQLAQQVSAEDIAPFAASNDGRVRQAAMEHCAALNRPDLLPVVASRLNDWVDQVRDAARNAVFTLVPACAPAHLLGILPAVLALKRARRSDHTAWIAAFEALLAARLSAQDFAAVIASPDIPMSRTAFELARRRDKIGHEALIALALERRNDILLAQATLALIVELPPPLRQPWYERLATSHFLLLRVAALEARLGDRSTAADILAVATLRDRAASMRNVAMRYLRGRAYDIRGFYRDLLLAPATRAWLACAALATLADLQSNADLSLVRSFVQASTPAVREAALAAWLKFAPASKDEIALLALGDPAPRLRGFALTVVRRQRAYIPLAQARAILMPLRDYPRLLRLAEHDQWQWLETLVQIVQVLDDGPVPDHATACTLRDSARSWCRQSTRYYAPPSPAQMALFDTPASQRALQALDIPASALQPL